MRDKMQEQIMNINNMVTKMSSMVTEGIEMAFEAFENRDFVLAKEVLKRDLDINVVEEEIEDLCVKFAATQSPVASDLRRLITILKVVTDLERIGDYSCNIAEVVLEMGDTGKGLLVPRLKEMENEVKGMLKDSMAAYFDRNIELAKGTAGRDELVDDLYDDIYRYLLLSIKEEKADEDRIIGHILIGRYLERIADHATNICERLIFMQTGERMKF
ncbi:phosphate signaling complex protein PhoU [Alkalibacter rhizosphaerae]|uniref:Phosphate-specific transport system accessory protein PhoU n=1 Tax=Alkalibacter rhizosphaerae TaxID=2815577 RepID=A0A974XHU1_9FIRM|nr:phosphate signaling complex protein PhoU [Alkalibacter rhizosphaerae]QSX09000.1 phosphate signaling complex protein PhoU [Alkalibacter rhizosphaerae]